MEGDGAQRVGAVASEQRKRPRGAVVAQDGAGVADDEGVVAPRLPGDAAQVLGGGRRQLLDRLAPEDEDGTAVADEEGLRAVRRPGGAAGVLALAGGERVEGVGM